MKPNTLAPIAAGILAAQRRDKGEKREKAPKKMKPYAFSLTPYFQTRYKKRRY